MLVEAGELTFGQLLLIFFDWLAIFIELDHLLEEGVLGTAVDSGVAVEDVTTVAAIVLSKL